MEGESNLISQKNSRYQSSLPATSRTQAPTIPRYLLQANRVVMIVSFLLTAAVAVCYWTDPIPPLTLLSKMPERNNYHPCHQNTP